MSSYVNATATGQGSHAFGSQVQIADVFVQLVTPGNLVVFDGTAPVRRVHKAGWVGLGAAASGIYNAFIAWARFLDYETRDFPSESDQTGVITNLVAVADTLWWDFTPGTTAYIEVTF